MFEICTLKRTDFVMLESRDMFGTKSTYILGQGFGNVFILKDKCGNEWCLVAMRPTYCSSKKDQWYKSVCVDLAEIRMQHPFGTVKRRQGLCLNSIHNGKDGTFWTFFANQKQSTSWNIGVDAEWYMENRHEEKKPHNKNSVLIVLSMEDWSGEN